MEFYRIKDSVVVERHSSEEGALLNLQPGEKIWQCPFVQTRVHLLIGYRGLDFLAGFPYGIWEKIETPPMEKGEYIPPPIGIFALRALVQMREEHDMAMRGAKMFTDDPKCAWLMDPRIWNIGNSRLVSRFSLVRLGRAALEGKDCSVFATMVDLTSVSTDMTTSEVLESFGMAEMDATRPTL